MPSRCCVIAHSPNFQSSFVGYSSFMLNKFFSQSNSCLEKPQLQTKLQPYKRPQTHLQLLRALSSFTPLGKMYSTIMETMTVFSSSVFKSFHCSNLCNWAPVLEMNTKRKMKTKIYIYFDLHNLKMWLSNCNINQREKKRLT